MSLLDQLAAFVCSANPAALPLLDQAIQRRHLTDVVVARIAGARTQEGRALAALEGGGGFTASGIAALAASVRLTEIDDIHIGSCTTASSVSVPVALALAAQGHAEPERVLGAVWAGTELLVRLGKAIDGASVLYQGIWPTRTGAPLAAAAVACRMWGLDQTRTAHALSLALMMTPSRIARFTGALSGRWVLFAAAVGDGIRAAEAARAGFCGDPTLLDGPWLENNLGVPVDLTQLTSDLGIASVYPELSLKPFCTSRQALSATEAMRGLLAEGLDPATIEAVRVRVPSAYAAMIGTRLDPKVRATSYVSAGAQMAIAAFAPEHLYNVDRAAILDDKRVQRLAGLVRVEADPALDSYFPKQWPAEIEVKTAQGTRKARVIDAPGDPGRRLDDAALEAKAAHVLAHLGLRDHAPRLVALGCQAATDTAACRELANVFVSASS